MSGQHTLYRFFDADGALLYVGRTIAPADRWRTHERNSLANYIDRLKASA